MKKYLGVTLGVLTAMGGFIDMGDIVANAEVGARFRMSLAWAVVVGVIGIMTFAEMAGRVATISKRPVFDVVRERLGAKVGLVNLAASWFITFLTLVAEVAGVALALELATDVNHVLWIPVVGFAVWAVIRKMTFQHLETVFGLLGLVLVVLAVALWRLGPDWGELLSSARPAVPATEGAPTYVYWAIALLGAAMTPYEVFFFSSGAVEERWDEADLVQNKANVFVGFPLGGLLSITLMASTATVFAPVEGTVANLSDAALPTVLALGKLGLALVLLGFFAATFGAALETAMSSAYTISQFLGWQWGKFVSPDRAPRFHGLVVITVGLASLVGLTAVDPVKVAEYSIVLSAAALPLTYLPIFVVANDPTYMGERVNGRLSNVIGSVYLVLLVVVAVVTIPLMIATRAGAG